METLQVDQRCFHFVIPSIVNNVKMTLQGKTAKRTWTCNEPAYVNNTTKTETVNREGRIAQTSNADDMRATVGEITCDCWISWWHSSAVKIVNSASLVLDESELQAGEDLVIRRRGPEGFLPSRVRLF